MEPTFTSGKPAMAAKPAFKEALKFWIKLGFISFGGPAGQIGIMHEYLVEKKKWVSDSKFLHALNYCMILPGPEAQQLATYIGWLLHGKKGGLAAGILFVLPSMFILLGLSMVYVTFGNVPWVYAMFNGLKPAVIAIVILALIKIGKKSLHSYFHYSIAAAAFICIFFLNVPFPLIILGAVLIAVLAGKLMPGLFKAKVKKEGKEPVNENEYYLNKYTVVTHAGFRPQSLAKFISTVVLLWIIPFVLFFLFTGNFQFWKTLSLFFTQAAFVTVGGAYAVLPYVAQVSVEKLQWLTSLEMIDGLALGETTPGPLIMVLAYVGFMAAHNHYSGSLAFGTLGLLTTTFFTFLPCFVFIFAGAPIIEKTQENKKVKEVLSLVTAAVVGVVLNLTIYLGKAVVLTTAAQGPAIDYVAVLWVIISFIGMYRFKISMISWIGISALFGLARYFFGV